MGERRGAYRVLVGKPEGKNHLEDLSVEGRMIVKWVFKKWAGVNGLDSPWSGQEQVAGSCECGTEPVGSIKFGKFID
jgi:hypothetical protein